MRKSTKTKTEIVEELNTLLNTAYYDLERYETMLVDNEVYDYLNEDMVALGRDARLVLLEAKNDCEHVIKRLNELLNKH